MKVDADDTRIGIGIRRDWGRGDGGEMEGKCLEIFDFHNDIF